MFKVNSISYNVNDIKVNYFGILVNVPIKFKWLAVDSLGSLCAYRSKPKILDDIWAEKIGGIHYIAKINYSGDWKDSLQKIVLPIVDISFAKQCFKNSYLKDHIIIDDGSIFLRYDTDDSDPDQQWDNYIDVVEELKKCGWKFIDACTEHDCISGAIEQISIHESKE
jgi:hypothetical protein